METELEPKLLFFREFETAYPPKKKTKGSIGYDLKSICDYVLRAGERVLCETGIRVVFPLGCYGRIASRSGLSWNRGIEVGAGMIDPDYQGTIRILLHNFGREYYKVYAGERIGQLILTQAKTVPIVEVFDASIFEKTERGDKGFGSTEVNSNKI